MLTHTQRGDPASLTYMCHYTPKLTLHTFLLPSEVPTVCTDTHAHTFTLTDTLVQRLPLERAEHPISQGQISWGNVEEV